MSYFNGDVVQQTYTGTEPTDFDSPANFTLNGVISGWSYTLIHMVVGDFGLCIFLIKVDMAQALMMVICKLIRH